MRYLLLILTAASCLAQAPKGASAGYRLRFSHMANDGTLAGRGMVGAWDLSGVGAGETISPLIGSTSLVVGTSSGDTTSNPTAQTGWMDFDNSGAANKLTAVDSAAISLTSTFTLQAVAKADVGNRILFSKWTGGGAGRSYIFYLGQDSANNKSSCAIVQSDTSTSAAMSPTDLTYSSGTWASWTCVANGSTIKVYKNGRPSTDTPVTYNGTINDSTTDLSIGTLGVADTTYGMTGSISYMSMSTVALTDAQVWKNYKTLRSRMAKQGITLP